MIPPLHSWNVSSKEAIIIQKKLRSQVQIVPYRDTVRYIGGADISFNQGADTLYAGIILLDYDQLTPVAHSLVQVKAQFPYVPGLLSFREIPALMKAWEQLELYPEVVMLDGHGIAHPRRLGVASHFGLWVGKPTLGCAKKLLIGLHECLEDQALSAKRLYDQEDIIGFALRSRTRIKPVYISPGHLLDQEAALAISRHCVAGYRIPEPTRQAHLLVNKLRRGEVETGFYTY